MGDAQDEDDFYKGPVTTEWLRKEARALLRLARQRSEVDFSTCLQYLQFLHKLGAESGPGTGPIGQRVRDEAWEKEARLRNGAVP